MHEGGAIGALQGLEVWKPVTVERGDFPIQDDVVDRKPGDRVHQGRKAEVEIVAPLGVEADLAIAFVNLAAPAVELHLMKPLRALRRLSPLGWKARFYEGKATQHTTYLCIEFCRAREPEPPKRKAKKQQVRREQCSSCWRLGQV